MPELVKRAALVLMAVFSCATDSLATDLRGQVYGYNAYTQQTYLRGGAQVKILAWNGSAWDSLQTAYTGPDGMYYFPRVPPGYYYLSIDGKNYPLQVPDSAYYDIAPIVLPN